jgi:hypothetical protein
MRIEFWRSKVLDVAIWKVQKGDNIKIVLRKICCQDYRWIELALDHEKWQNLILVLMG